METRAIIALLGIFVAAVATADVWRWVDENGVVHFSDTPVEGAERIDVSEASRTTGARVYTPPPRISADGEPAPARSPRGAISRRCSACSASPRTAATAGARGSGGRP